MSLTAAALQHHSPGRHNESRDQGVGWLSRRARYRPRPLRSQKSSAPASRYRYYVVWFLFVVYVFNFVDRQILTIADRADQERIRAARLAARRAQRHGVRAVLLDLRHSDRALGGQEQSRQHHRAVAAHLELCHGGDGVRAQLLAAVRRARRRRHRRIGLQPAGATRSSATTSSRNGAARRCRSTRWACTAAPSSA